MKALTQREFPANNTLYQWTEHKYFTEYLKMGQWNSPIDVESESHQNDMDPKLTEEIINMTSEKAEIDHCRAHLGQYH